MLAALTLAFALSAEPGGIHLEPTPRRARIVFAALMTSEQIADSPVERLSLSQLRIEEHRLVDPPTIVLPVVLMCVGGTGLVGGGLSAYYLFSQIPNSGIGGIFLAIFGIFAAAIAIVGGVGLVAGIILLPQRLDARAAYLERSVAVRARISAIEAGSVTAPPEPDAPYGGPAGQLQTDLNRLEEQRPGLGLPIGLMAGGGGLGLYATYYWLGGASGGSTNNSTLTAVGVGGIVAGLAMIGLGIYFLIDRLNTRSELDAKIRELRDGEAPGLGPPPPPQQVPPGGDVVPPPPPPPPPPQAYTLPPPPVFALMTFQF